MTGYQLPLVDLSGVLGVFAQCYLGWEFAHNLCASLVACVFKVYQIDIDTLYCLHKLNQVRSQAGLGPRTVLHS